MPTRSTSLGGSWRRHVVRHLLQLGRATALVDRDQAVLVELLLLPLGLGGHRAERGEDVGGRGARGDAAARHEDLVAPEDRAPPRPRRRVARRLPHHALEDRDRLRRPVDRDEGGQLDTGLVVVLGAGQGREARPLTRRVVQRHRRAARICREVDAARARLGACLLEGVQRAEAVTGAAVPVLVDAEDDARRARHLLDRRHQPLLPVVFRREVEQHTMRKSNLVRPRHRRNLAHHLGLSAWSPSCRR